MRMDILYQMHVSIKVTISHITEITSSCKTIIF